MNINKTTLTHEEKNWILEQRLIRLSDEKEVLIYPMGAERYLSAVLFGNKPDRYNIRADIVGKDILVLPGYGNNGFLFAQAGANSVTLYDKDPVTIAWVKAFKKYYHYREYDEQGTPYPSVGELLTILTRWYPPAIHLPTGKYKRILLWLFNPKSLRRSSIYYLLSLIRHAVQLNVAEDFEWDKNIQFQTGEISQLIACDEKQIFDTAFIPYLLGVRNGIESEAEIVHFIEQLATLVPTGRLLVTPSQNTKELMGQRYFVTTAYPSIKSIPGLEAYFIGEDSGWYNMQGLAVLALPKA